MVVDDEPFNIQAIEGMMAILRLVDLSLIDKCFNGE